MKNAIVIILMLIVCKVNAQYLKKAPYMFDAGAIDSKVFEDNKLITDKDVYNIETGWGWTIKPDSSYYNKNLAKSTVRNELTVDGLIGKEVAFKIDIPEGKWNFIFWMEQGTEDVNSASLLINDEKQNINWHQYHSEGVGAAVLRKYYRVYQTNTIVKSGFEFKLSGGKDSVRILGFSLIPFGEEPGSDYTQLNKIILLAGKYKSKVNLFDLSSAINEKFKSNPNDSYLAYWKQQSRLLAEADRLINMMGWEWARQLTNMSIFDRFHQALNILDTQLEHFDYKNHAFKERSLWLRGKLCYDLFRERGGSYTSEISKKDLKELFNIYPDDINLRMFNGDKIDFPDGCDNLTFAENAPEWSKLQHEVICRLGNEIDWWVNERQAPNGELGGKIGDDVELLRWWSPFLLYGHKSTIKGWKNLADAVWNDPKVYLGYSRSINDVEHASEFISDSTPELIFIDEDSTYFNRLFYTADHFEKLWSVKHNDGSRYFKSAWYSSTEVDERKYKNKDVDYNARALKPLRYLAWSTRNQHFIDLLMEWSRGWVNAALSTDKNKPKGILPATVDAYTKEINGDQDDWYESGLYYEYFDWRFSAGSKILDNILFTYSLTKNDSLLLPVKLTLELIKNNIQSDKNFLNNEYETGSEKWAVSTIIKKDGFWNAVGKWRFFTGNTEYDNLILEYGTDYLKYKLTNDESYVCSNLKSTLEYLRFNTPLRTSLVVHTDRVRTPGAENLKAMLVGDGTSEGSSPYYSITWADTDTDFTAFVKESDSVKIAADIFYHTDMTKIIGAKLWQLNYGNYKILLKDNDVVISEQEITITEPGKKITLEIPGNKLITLEIDKID